MVRAWIFLLLFLFIPAAHAQQTLRVALVGAPPFVMRDGDAQTGFAADLWQSVAAASGWRFEYRPFETTEAALASVEAGTSDVLVGNTSITSEREKKVEFSQPFYRAGFQIMVSEQRGQMARVFGRLVERQNLEVLAGVLAVVLIATLAIAAFERRHNPDFPRTPVAGIVEAFYYVVGSLTGQAAYSGFHGVKGRLVLVCWMLASLLVVSYVTGVLASAMTVDSLRGHINGPQDLADRMVGVIGGTESENYARAKNLDYKAYPSLDAAVGDMVKGGVQCLVGDAPVLEYYDYTHPRVPIHEVGPVFQPVNYGFAMPPNSPLRASVNFALLHLVETGALDVLGKTYFGESYQK